MKISVVGGDEVARFTAACWRPDEVAFHAQVLGLCDEIDDLLIKPETPNWRAVLERLTWLLSVNRLSNNTTIRVMLLLVGVRELAEQETLKTKADRALMEQVNRVYVLVVAKISEPA